MIIKSPMMKAYFFLMLVSTLTDVALLAFSHDYRNMLGMVDGRGFENYAFRTLPGIVLVSLYLFIFQKIMKGDQISRVLVAGQAVLFAVLGIGICLPWMGHIIAPLTPIAAPYLALLLWAENYVTASAVAIIFVVVNIFVILTACRDNSADLTPQ